MSRIAAVFESLRTRRRPAFMPFVVAGDPDLRTTARVVETLVDAGADLVELGVPFSDPVADGPTNQRAYLRALAGGTQLAQVLDLVTATMNLILGNRQSASTSFELNRSYYQMTRLMAYVFVIGGWGDTSPPGPTGTVERHIQ